MDLMLKIIKLENQMYESITDEDREEFSMMQLHQLKLKANEIRCELGFPWNKCIEKAREWMRE